MEPSSSIIMILVTALLVINGKDIANYFEWLRFKIRIYFKQMQNNERYNYSNNRSRELLSKQQRSLQRQQWQLDSSGRANNPRKQRVF